MRCAALQSGSTGNCYFIASGNTRLLIDAGISGLQAEQRLAVMGEEIRHCQALLITHDHRDHAEKLGIYHRKYDLPVYITEATFEAAQRRHRFGRLDRLYHFQAGDRWQIGELGISTLPTPHDAADGVAVVVEDGRHRVGILSDLGHLFDGLGEVLGQLDAVMLESNYDEQMLRAGSYPDWLKDRIRGPGGHISNAEAAELLRLGQHRLQWACLCHLSEENNCPHVALQTARQATGERLQLLVSPRDRATPMLRVE
jgi:phosphoribosyl 1,2-cyclic phosphodiesterase